MTLGPYVRLEVVPVSRTEMRVFVREHHRHSKPPVGDVLRAGLVDGDRLVAVACAGRPIAPGLQDGRSLEITRVCTVGTRNACSMLYGALGRAAKALGYRVLWTYTLESEDGVSPRAAGFVLDAVLEERDWAEQSGRSRYTENLFGESVDPPGRKLRWKRVLR